MNPFNGVHERPRINVTVNSQVRSWLFDTGSSVTCMPPAIFKDTFKDKLPKKVTQHSAFKSADGGLMKVLGAYTLPLTIRGHTYEQTVYVLDSLNDCIIGIDFMHIHKARYDPEHRRIQFKSSIIEAIAASKEVNIPAFSSKIIKTTFQGLRMPEAHCVATITAPLHQHITGSPQWVNLSNYNTCLVVVDNSSPEDVTIRRGDTVGFLDQELEQPIPFNADELEQVVNAIAQKNKFSDK